MAMAWFGLLFGLHCLSFVAEGLYQRWCYPVSWTGLFTSIITNSSATCTALRAVSQNTDYVFLNVMIAWSVASVGKLINCVKQN